MAVLRGDMEDGLKLVPEADRATGYGDARNTPRESQDGVRGLGGGCGFWMEPKGAGLKLPVSENCPDILAE